MRTPHLSEEELLQLAKGGHLEAGERPARHLAECELCRSDLESFKTMAASLRDPAPDAPDWVRRRAYALLEPSRPMPGELKRFPLARLIEESAAAPMAAGIRGSLGSRRQFWRTPLADIDLRLEGEGLGAKAKLVGQLLPRGHGTPASAGSAWLMEPGGKPRYAAILESGEFLLPAPRGKRWTLALEWGRIRARVKSS